MKRRIGWALIVFICLTSINFYWLAQTNSGIDISGSPTKMASQLAAILGTTLLSITFFLSAKWRMLEKWFGGLDRLFTAHQRVGSFAYLLLLQHPVLLTVQALPNLTLAKSYLWPGTSIAYNLGILSLGVLSGLIYLTLFTKLPYHVWKKTHEWMGLVVLGGLLHVYLIPTSLFDFIPLKVWMLTLLCLSFISALYTRFLYRYFGPKHRFVLNYIHIDGDVATLRLKSISDKFTYTAGQYGFIRFEREGLGEMHPFSFASAPEETEVRILVKVVGDYTVQLPHLVTGAEATIYGPYGVHLSQVADQKQVVMIAGGIGITPYLSFLRQAVFVGLKQTVTLFYSGKRLEGDRVTRELKTIQSHLPSLRLQLIDTGKEGRLTAKAIVEQVTDIAETMFCLCGPPIMMFELKNQLRFFGVKSKQIVFEDFSWR